MTTSAASAAPCAWNGRLLPNGTTRPAPLLSFRHMGTDKPAVLSAEDPPRGRVLVVERNAVLALDIQRTLRDAGFRVIGPAASLTDIQRLLDHGAIDAAIVDLDVDRGTPLPVADLLAFADIPFVFLAADGRPDVPQRHSRRPVVQKPFLAADLVAAVEKVLARREKACNDNGWQDLTTVAPSARIYPLL